MNLNQKKAWLVIGAFIFTLMSCGNKNEISNGILKLSYNDSDNAITIENYTKGDLSLVTHASAEEVKLVETVKNNNSVFGLGEALEISYTNGRVDLFTLYENQEFVFIQTKLTNSGDKEINLTELELLTLNVNWDKKPDSLKALGTAGLTAVDKHPGSYMFLALAEPETRNGVVGAWLTAERGSGILFSDIDSASVSMSAKADYGRLLVQPGEQVEGETFILGYFDDVRTGLEKYADNIALNFDIQLPPQPDGYCTWYAEKYGRASDEEHIIELANFVKKELVPFGFDFIQIDDFWQDGEKNNGPRKVFERIKPDGPYKNGMQPTAKKIKALGITPGIWWMPFAGTWDDPYFSDKQDFFTKEKSGKPYDTAWGGTALDMTNPEARNFVGFLSNRLANEWGYKYFKIDGLWLGTSTKQIYINHGYRNDDDLGTQIVHNPKITPIEAHRLGLNTIINSAGDDVFILGCNLSQNMRTFGASFGLVDAMRIGPDNNSDFSSLKKGPWTGTNRYFLQNRVWYNDPDPYYVRNSMPVNHARLICTWVGISGQLATGSDWLPDLKAERLDIIKRITPNHGKNARPADLLENEFPQIWTLADNESGVERLTVGVYNWNNKKAKTINYSVDKLGLDSNKKYIGFDFWKNEALTPFSGELTVKLTPGSCAALSIREQSENPMVISTSRHITQGIVDIVKEEWDATTSTLYGTSNIVMNDKYEIRIALPESKNNELESFIIDSENAEVISQVQDGSILRITLLSPVNEVIGWKASFE